MRGKEEERQVEGVSERAEEPSRSSAAAAASLASHGSLQADRHVPRRLQRMERALDDPLRDMDGLVANEYGRWGRAGQGQGQGEGQPVARVVCCYW